MKFTIAPLLLLACSCCGVAASPTLTVPETVKGEVADYIKVTAKTDGKVVKWFPLDKGLKLFPIELLKDTKTAVVSSALAGKYRLMSITALADELSDPQITTVEVTNGEVVPPKPPDPKPPGPESELVKSLKAAYAKDTDTDRATTLASLTALYMAWDSITTDKLLVKTVGDVIKVLQASATTMGLKPTQLVNLRKAVGEHLKSKLGDYSKGMDEDTKRLVLATLSEIAHALKEVGK